MWSGLHLPRGLARDSSYDVSRSRLTQEILLLSWTGIDLPSRLGRDSSSQLGRSWLTQLVGHGFSLWGGQVAQDHTTALPDKPANIDINSYFGSTLLIAGISIFNLISRSFSSQPSRITFSFVRHTCNMVCSRSWCVKVKGPIALQMGFPFLSEIGKSKKPVVADQCCSQPGFRIRCFCLDLDPDPVFKFLWIQVSAPGSASKKRVQKWLKSYLL